MYGYRKFSWLYQQAEATWTSSLVLTLANEKLHHAEPGGGALLAGVVSNLITIVNVTTS